MSCENVFSDKNVFLNVDANNKEDVLRFISVKAKELSIIRDSEELYRGLLDRDIQYSTNLGEFIAIPHAKSNSILHPAVLVLKFNKSVKWNDGEEEVKLAISLLVPDELEGNVHLKLLSALSRRLIDTNFKNELLSSHDINEITKLINSALIS